jgi:hypothetical protein
LYILKEADLYGMLLFIHQTTWQDIPEGSNHYSNSSMGSARLPRHKHVNCESGIVQGKRPIPVVEGLRPLA